MKTKAHYENNISLKFKQAYANVLMFLCI